MTKRVVAYGLGDRGVCVLLARQVPDPLKSVKKSQAFPEDRCVNLMHLCHQVESADISSFEEDVMPNQLKKMTKVPVTRSRLPMPEKGTDEWIIWAAWADRVTFEEIKQTTGLSEKEVIRFMRQHQTPKTFRRWRQRVTARTTKHRKRFADGR